LGLGADVNPTIPSVTEPDGGVGSISPGAASWPYRALPPPPLQPGAPVAGRPSDSVEQEEQSVRGIQFRRRAMGRSGVADQHSLMPPAELCRTVLVGRMVVEVLSAVNQDRVC
jgi:hypothetical protein